jgi:serine/threonine protein phosphatase PrpC
VERLKNAAICVISDGAGSCEYADEGSKFAVEFAADFLRKLFEDGFDFSDKTNFAQKLDELIIALQEGIKSEAAAKARNYKDYGATLHALVAGGDFIAYMHLGDGALVYLDTKKEYQLALPPIKGKQDNQTVFFTSDFAREKAEIFYLPYSPSFFSLATDGIEKISLLGRAKGWSPYPPFFAHLRSLLETDAPEKELLKFIRRKDMEERTNDDRTVIIAKKSETIEQAGDEEIRDLTEQAEELSAPEVEKSKFKEAEEREIARADVDGEIAEVSAMIEEAEEKSDTKLAESLNEKLLGLAEKRDKI